MPYAPWMAKLGFMGDIMKLKKMGRDVQQTLVMWGNPEALFPGLNCPYLLVSNPATFNKNGGDRNPYHWELLLTDRSWNTLIFLNGNVYLLSMSIKQNPRGYLYALLSGSSVRFAAGKDLYTHFIFLLCDWFSSAVFVVLGTCIAVQLGTNPDWMFFCCFAGTFMFYCAHWQTYVSGTLRFGM